MKTPIEQANDRAMRRYGEMVQIEMGEDAVHVTLDGKHFTNDAAAFARAMELLRSQAPAIMSKSE